MRQASKRIPESAEKTVRDIRRATRRHHSAEEKIRIVLEGLRGEVSIAELCRKEGINQNLYYRWSKEFLEAGKKRLRMVTLRQDTKGNFSARKRLPEDVREEYGRRHGQRLEAKFFTAASKGAAKAKRELRDWETEVAGRIAATHASKLSSSAFASVSKPSVNHPYTGANSSRACCGLP